MKKPYKLYKVFICDLTKEQCGFTWPYSEYMPKPKCETCDLFIEASLEKHGLKKEEK